MIPTLLQRLSNTANVDEAELLRELGVQTRGKHLFGFEFSFHAKPTASFGLQLRYCVVIAQGREVAEKIAHRYWRSAWSESNATVRKISPETAFLFDAFVLLERQDDSTSSGVVHGCSLVDDRCMLAALLAAVVREGDRP